MFPIDILLPAPASHSSVEMQMMTCGAWRAVIAATRLSMIGSFASALSNWPHLLHSHEQRGIRKSRRICNSHHAMSST